MMRELIKVRVRTKADRSIVKKYDPESETYFIDIESPPENGKANKEILKILSKRFKRRLRIISGSKSKNKVLEFID